MTIRNLKNKGFTLLELIVVVLIIGLLTAIALPKYFKVVDRAHLSEAILLANILEKSIGYHVEKGSIGQGKAIMNIDLQGSSWDEDNLKYSTKMHSLDFSCTQEECQAHVYFPKTGSAKYTLTLSGRKGEAINKTCQGPQHICTLLEDKGYRGI